MPSVPSAGVVVVMGWEVRYKDLAEDEGSRRCRYFSDSCLR